MAEIYKITQNYRNEVDAGIALSFHIVHSLPCAADYGRSFTRSRNMKTFPDRLALAILTLSGVLCLVSCGPPPRNDGRESGYFADFNRVSNALVSIHGIVITNFWMNRDITLEEFGFDVTNSTGKVVHIALSEPDPLRRMSRAELVEALKKKIERQSP